MERAIHGMQRAGEEYLDVHGIARATGTPASWWYAAGEAGRVPSYKIGRYRRFKLSEIEQWLSQQRQTVR
jgi:excisionase family DNA binding protein